MEDKIIIRENEKLLEAAKNLFGPELVANAWLCTDCEDFYTVADYKEQLDNRETYLRTDDTKIDLDAISFIIKLVNGNCLEFTASEWGAITKIPEANLQRE